MQPDDQVSKRYREIAREAPDAALDAAILAASRRALRPSVAKRWGAPVSIAAVLVLAFGLTLEMRHEEPGIETSLPAPPAGAPAALPQVEPERAPPVPDVKPKVAPIAKPAKPAPAPVAREERHVMPLAKDRAAPSAAERRAPAAFPATPAPASAAAPARAAQAPAAEAPQAADRLAPAPPLRAEPSTAGRPASVELDAAPANAARAKASADTMQRAQGAIAASPEIRELERIAQLRAEGRDAEADGALEDFRRDHPAYRIPEAMWERVKPR